MIHHMTKYPPLSLGTALLTLLASCATLTYEQVNLPTSFKTYGPDYQFRVLNLEEKTTISILDENKEEKSLTADEKYYYIVLTIEIVRFEFDILITAEDVDVQLNTKKAM